MQTHSTLGRRQRRQAEHVTETRGSTIAARWTDNRIALTIFVAVSLIYVALSRGVFLYGDDILMFQVTESIVERGTFAVTSPHDEGDNARSIPGEDGRGYAKYGIGQSLVAIPLYVVSDLLLDPLLPLEEEHDPYGNQRLGPVIYGTSLTNALLGGGAVALLWLLARAIGDSRPTAFVLALLLAFATPLAHYAATFLSEPLTMLALLMTVYGLVRTASGRWTCDAGIPAHHRVPRPTSATQSVPGPSPDVFAWLALSGFAAGLALASRIAVGVALVAPGLWLLWLGWEWGRQRWRDGLLACVAWGVPVALWLAGIGAYNWVRFGSVLETGYGDEAGEFTEPFLTGLTGLLVSPGKGLLWYSAPLLLAIAGSWRFARRRPDLALVITGMFAATLALYSRYYVWDGGGVWGTRFLLPLVPLLLLPAGEVIERLWQPLSHRRLVTGAVIVVAALGLWISAVSIIVPFDRYVNEYNASAELKDAATWEIADSPIVVHTERADDFTTGPDIAAVRYNVMRLAVISAVTSLVGVVMLWWVWSGIGIRDSGADSAVRYSYPTER
jgi:4-amino-4-deoxy-L-arabinose transferase-like glycosyltransferase